MKKISYMYLREHTVVTEYEKLQFLWDNMFRFRENVEFL
jgi:hypothetical protein